MRTRTRHSRGGRTTAKCSRPRQLARDHLRRRGLEELLRHLLGRLDALLRGDVILGSWELMQWRGDLRDGAATLRGSGDSAAHGGFSCHHRPNTCCCGLTGEPFDPSTPLLSSPPSFGSATDSAGSGSTSFFGFRENNRRSVAVLWTWCRSGFGRR